MTTNFYIPAASCDHCKQRIEGALSQAGIEGSLNLADKTLSVTTERDPNEVAQILETAGYPAEAPPEHECCGGNGSGGGCCGGH